VSNRNTRGCPAGTLPRQIGRRQDFTHEERQLAASEEISTDELHQLAGTTGTMIVSFPI